MDWLLLLLAGLLEIGWAIGLKYSEGFTRFWPAVLTAVGIVASFLLLAVALRTIPVGTGYAVWTGIGAAGTALLGMVILGEPVSMARILCILLIVCGVMGLKFAA